MRRLIPLLALPLAACVVTPDDDDDDALPPDPATVQAGELAATGLSLDVPPLDALLLRDRDVRGTPADLVVAAEGLDCGRLSALYAATDAAYAEAAESGDWGPYHEAIGAAWNEPHALPTWWITLQLPAGEAAVGPWTAAVAPAIAISRLDPAEGDAALPYTARAASGEQQFVSARLDSVDGGLTGTFEFSVQTGIEGDGTWVIDEVELVLDAPWCPIPSGAR